jgi:hypothetical protein
MPLRLLLPHTQPAPQLLLPPPQVTRFAESGFNKEQNAGPILNLGYVTGLARSLCDAAATPNQRCSCC